MTKEMNWDTNEVRLVIESDFNYYTYLKEIDGNELYFMVVLYAIIKDYNSRGNEIDISKVNGNEVYMSFCEAVGVENEGGCGNETWLEMNRHFRNETHHRNERGNEHAKNHRNEPTGGR